MPRYLQKLLAFALFFLGTIAGGFAQEAGGCPRIFSAYDKNNRLIREQCKAAVPAASRDTHYVYDSANNRLQRTVNGAVTDYSYNALNQLTGTTGAEVSTYTYDLAGNRLTRTGAGTNARYAYDQENRLTSLTDATGTYAYAYDYRTRRVTRNENSITTRSIYSGGTSYAEYAGTSLATPVVENIRGSDMGGGIGGILYTLRPNPLIPQDPATPSYTHYNSRGDVTAKTNTTGLATYTAQYEAFGKRTLETGNTADRQRANTKDEDPTGLLNEGFRYRDLETGTFLTRDPAGFIDGPNLYAYVIQNPWTAFDPEGLSTRQDIFDSAVNDFIDYNQNGSNWSNVKGVAKLAALTVVDVFSLGTFAKNSAIADEVSAGNMSASSGFAQMAGNTGVGAASLLAGGGAAGMIKSAGGGLITQGAAFGFTQSVSQIGGERTIAGINGGQYCGTVESDMKQVAISTAFGAALGVAGKIDAAIAANRAANVVSTMHAQASISASPKHGVTVYRVWGGKSGPWGESWTTKNPNLVENFRSEAGLPDVNTGRFVSEGTLRTAEGVTARGALIIKQGQKGNLPELVIKNAENNVHLHNVLGANPEF